MDALQLFDWKNSITAIDELEKLLQCAACGALAQDPQRLGRCDHHFCRGCVEALDNGTCPTCRVPAPPCEMQPDHIIGDLQASCRDLRALILGGSGGGLGREGEVMGAGKTQHTPQRNNSNNNNNNSKHQQEPGTAKNKTKPSKEQTEVKTAGRKTKIPKASKTNTPGRPTTTTTTTPAIAATPKAEKRPKGTPAGEVKKIGRMCGDLSVLGMSPGAGTLDRKNAKGETQLHVACIKGDREKVKQLLSEGANPNTKDNAGWTPLHEVCSHGYEDIAVLLLRHGAVVDPVGGGNSTPLHDAVTQGQLGLIRLLRAWGAADDARNIQGHTPRSLAKLCAGAEEISMALDTTPDPSLPRPTPAPPLMDKMILLGAGLSRQQAKKLDTLGRMLRVKVVLDYSSEVTHIVTECSLERVVMLRTPAYMMGVVAGKWILSHTWMDECLRMESPVSPAEYEAVGFVALSSPCQGPPVLGRTNAEKLRPPLFSGCHMYLWGSFPGSSRRETEALVRAGGGVVLAREPNPEAISEDERKVPYHATPDSPLACCSHYIIYPNNPSHHPQIKYDMSHIKSLPLAWLYWCVDAFRLVPPVKC